MPYLGSPTDRVYAVLDKELRIISIHRYMVDARKAFLKNPNAQEIRYTHVPDMYTLQRKEHDV